MDLIFLVKSFFSVDSKDLIAAKRDRPATYYRPAKYYPPFSHHSDLDLAYKPINCNDRGGITPLSESETAAWESKDVEEHAKPVYENLRNTSVS
ncbi:MAG: hypothetical protein LBU39_06990 [Desulfobulbaceae bacterium]|jgi:hypothetical protein|nr:hypothetical protein [Desulfobulbaceae bacterium]